MSTDYGVPPGAETTRAMVEARLHEQREKNGVAETLTVEWRGAPLHIQVIDMPLSSLVYNPETHRIRAQRSYDPKRDAILAADPWSPESQDYLRYLLTIRPSDPQHLRFPPNGGQMFTQRSLRLSPETARSGWG